MTPETEKIFDIMFRELAQARKDKVISDDDYHKAIVATAFELAAQGEVVRAAAAIQQIPVEYFQTVQTKQMAEDPNYAYASYSLALLLVQAGLVHVGPVPVPNMEPARA